MTRIALDAVGGDFGAKPNVQGAVQAAKELGVEVILVGDEAVLTKELNDLGYSGLPTNISIVHAPDIIDMSADPSKECKSKPHASIVVCADLVHQGKADALVSAGNTGAAMVASLFKLRRLKGVVRPAITAPMPTYKGISLLLDAGANADCKPIHLLQFAVMGSVYMHKIYDIENPTVGILSIGEEESKGNLLVKNTIPHMRKIGVNYMGPVEGRDVNTGDADVIVCDGFVGNIVLKMAEGLAKTMFRMIKREIGRQGLRAKMGALMAKPAFQAIKEYTDPDTAGGAPLLGVNGIVIICHGKSGQKAIFNALKAADKLAEKDFLGELSEKMTALKETFANLEDQSDKGE